MSDDSGPTPIAHCIHCSYELTGLAYSANCPECGSPVQDSLRGDLLVFRQPEYVLKLRRGAFLVETSINLTVGSLALMLVYVLTLAVAGMHNTWFFGAGIIVLTLVFLAGLVLFPIGWWLLSSPDPGRADIAGEQRARRLIRVTVAITVFSSLVSAANEMIFRGQLFSGSASSVFSQLLELIRTVMQFTTLAAWLVQFFSAMVYLRWLAKQIPNLRIYQRAGTLMWLGPLLSLPYCLLIPPLIALVLYGNLLSWVKEALTQIAEQQRGIGRPVSES
ncbi:MAG: hypothetical protein KF691_00340 [Phycisphaeraceae bacterium]|nr:hypothetical protein [Phycisphaeraceae bacterium]